MLQVIGSVVFGFALMMVMIVGCLTATVLLLAIMSWVVDGASHALGTSSRNRPLG
jgi:hypothetical protein